MKTLFFILAIGVFAACGSGDRRYDTTPSDSASPVPDNKSMNPNGAMPDTATLNRDQNHLQGDTSSSKSDSLHSTTTH